MSQDNINGKDFKRILKRFKDEMIKRIDGINTHAQSGYYDDNIDYILAMGRQAKVIKQALENSPNLVETSFSVYQEACTADGTKKDFKADRNSQAMNKSVTNLIDITSEAAHDPKSDEQVMLNVLDDFAAKFKPKGLTQN